MREMIIAGNWKMNKNAPDCREFCAELAKRNLAMPGVLPLVAPSYPFLGLTAEILSGKGVAIAAQDVSAYLPGAFTGEVAATQLASLGVSHCIIGHSERRQYHAETDAIVRDKCLRLLEVGLVPIVCVGETLSQREAGETQQVVLSQLTGSLAGIDLTSGKEAVIAYEPVWAIGTGLTASAAQAQEVHGLIRGWLSANYDPTVAAELRILYGGSVKPGNLGELLAQPDIDGGLIGGASLQVEDFLAMVQIAAALSR